MFFGKKEGFVYLMGVFLFSFFTFNVGAQIIFLFIFANLIHISAFDKEFNKLELLHVRV